MGDEAGGVGSGARRSLVGEWGGPLTTNTALRLIAACPEGPMSGSSICREYRVTCAGVRPSATSNDGAPNDAISHSATPGRRWSSRPAQTFESRLEKSVKTWRGNCRGSTGAAEGRGSSVDLVKICTQQQLLSP